jgi:hypothetical protein
MKPTNGTIRHDVQFSIFLANKPQTLARVCQQLADDKVNIIAMRMMDSSEHGVLRLVATNAAEARTSLSRMDVPTAETQVLMATLPNKPGALADVVERLSTAHVSVNYAYCTAGAPGGKTVGVFRVSDIKKAGKVLEERQPRRKMATKPKTKTVRKPPAGRRK